MGKYVLQKGKHNGFNPETGERQTFVKGDVVELTPAAAKAFADKFKSMNVVKAEAQVAAAQLETIKRIEAEKAKPNVENVIAQPSASETKTETDSGASGSGGSPASDQKDGDSADKSNTAPQSQHAPASTSGQAPASKTVVSK